MPESSLLYSLCLFVPVFNIHRVFEGEELALLSVPSTTECKFTINVIHSLTHCVLVSTSSRCFSSLLTCQLVLLVC